MEGIAAEVSQKLKSAIKAKLMELGAYVDDELSNYVMVMVTNRRSKAEMDRELQLFLGGNTSAFTSWLQSVWMKLEQVTVTNSGIDNAKRKKKVKKGAKSSSESEDEKKPKKKRKTSVSDIAGKEVKKRKASKVTSAGSLKAELFSEENLSDTPSTDAKSVSTSATKKNKNPVSPIEEDDFLSIKEDFESEFLSDDDSLDAPVKGKPPPVENMTVVVSVPTKKLSLLKPESNEKLAIAETLFADRKHLTNRHTKESAEPTKELSVARRLTPPDVVKTSATGPSKIVLKAASDIKAIPIEAVTVTAMTTAATRKTLLIRDRKPQSQPRSPSKKPAEILRSKSKSPAAPALTSKNLRQRSRSRLSRSRSSSASPSPPRTVKQRVRGAGGRDSSGSPSRNQSQGGGGGLSTIVIKSRSRSPAAARKSSSSSSAAVVDARELINRKRAMVSANEHLSGGAKDEKALAKRQLITCKHEIVDVDEVGCKKRGALSRLKPLKSRERYKEKVSVENSQEVEDVDDNDDDDGNDRGDCDRHIDQGRNDSELVNHDDDDNHDDATDRDDGDNDDNDVEADDDAYYEPNEEGKPKKKFGRFVVSQQGGTRSVTMRSALEKKTSILGASKKEKSDLRNVRRQVGETAANDERVVDDNADDDEGDVKSSKDDKVKTRKSKSVMNQIVKYIKEEPPANTSSSKIGKISRPKGGNVPSASSTLIRKAMADAHKSLSSSKEESSKRKEQLSNNVLSSNSRISEEETVIVDHDISDPGELVITEENRVSGDDEMMMDADMEYNPEEQVNHRSDIDVAMESTEEYDPSKNMPQFVVTLTGLDPKLYPQEDFEMADMDPMMDDIRLKSRSQERCKYYPNCLAGNQCLYYHPVIPCKAFPNCKYGSNCLYIHPKCKFDSSCTRYDCTYTHSSPRILPPVPPRHPVASGGMKLQPCKYYFNCVNPVCPYQHPKICRYDRFCTNKNCTFSHTSISHVGSSYVAQYSVSQDKLRWCRPKDGSENKNDSAEAKIELEAATATAAVEN